MKKRTPRQLRQSAWSEYRQGRTLAALQQLDQLIGLAAADASDWLLTGRLLSELGEFAQATGAYEQCLQLDPQHIEARYELGRGLYKLGDADRAAELIEQVARETEQLEVWLGLATIAPAVPAYDLQRVRAVREKFAALMRQAEGADKRPLQPARRSATTPPGTGPTRRLRLGYLSAHWHDANYMKPVWPLINAHDRSQFEIILFDDGLRPDAAWDWLQGEASCHTLHGLDNRQAAQRMADAELDILVDLSAYSKPERLGVFVYRPAPVQAAWFNMYATSGFHEIDYLIGDEQVIGSGEQVHYTERCWPLPLSYLTFQTNHSAPEVVLRPDLQQVPFTFGCLGTLYKLAPTVIAAWCEILCEAQSARLVLSGRELKSACNRQFVLDQFQRGGISSDRITILPPAAHYEFLRYYDQIDVALDTFPYNGGTTTMEALWQGVPVLCFRGDRWAARTSRSLVENCHLSEFCVASRQEYIRTAVRLATEPMWRAKLQLIRPLMREKLSAASVCDSQGLARALEQFYFQAAR